MHLCIPSGLWNTESFFFSFFFLSALMMESLVMAVSWAGRPMMSRTSAALAILAIQICLSEISQLLWTICFLLCAISWLQSSGISICSTALKVFRSNICCISSRVAHWKSFRGSCFKALLLDCCRVLTELDQILFVLLFVYLYSDTWFLINLVLNVSLRIVIKKFFKAKLKFVPCIWKLWLLWLLAFQPSALGICTCRSLMEHFLIASTSLWY